MRATSVGFYLALGLKALGALGALAMAALMTTSGCGQLWRPFLDPEVVPPDDLAVADLASPTAPPEDLAAPVWSVEESSTRQTLYGVWGINYTYSQGTFTDGGTVFTDISQTPIVAVGAAGTLVQRSEKGVWTAYQLNPSGAASSDFYAVTGRGPGDVIAVGDSQLVAQWNGSRLSGSLGNVDSPFLGVAPLVGQDGYLAVGTADLLSIISGTTRSTPGGYTRGQVDLTSTCSSESRVWIGTGRGDLIKYEQGSFSSAGLPKGSPIRAIWARSATEVWAVGDSGYVLRYDGVSWSTVKTGLSGLTLNLHGVTGNRRGEVWMVGDGGTTLYFNGTAWTQWQSPTLGALRGVFLEPVTGGLWAVGDQGVILHAVTATK